VLIGVSIIFNSARVDCPMKGIPSRKRYQIATVFVNHASDYTYMHFQTNATSEKTLTAKHEFERHALGAGISIKRVQWKVC
jgi:hypothetical protein